MALFTGRARRDYAGPMPKPERGDGPWGEAIEYWMTQRRWRQADVVRALEVLFPPKTKKSKGYKNTVSTAANGFDVNTRSLRRIAKALDAPLDAVLVSPLRKAANEERLKLALDITGRVLRQLESVGHPVAVAVTTTDQDESVQQEPPFTKTMQADLDDFKAKEKKKPRKRQRKQPRQPPNHRRKANNG